MATVWKAEVVGASGFTRPVAVKRMHPHLAAQPRYVIMFREEARVGACLNHPNIAQIYDFVRHENQLYLIAEWIDGIELGASIRTLFGTGRVTSWDIVCAVGIGLLRGLSAAHERLSPDGSPAPVIHRDVSRVSGTTAFMPGSTPS